MIAPPKGATGTYPDGKRFAFTILDDTDDSTLDNVRPIYDLLYEIGMRTTKSVWPVECPEGSRDFFAAETLANDAYLEYVRELVKRGFELASHGATMESSRRERTLQGLTRLDELFDTRIRVHCNHGGNLENLYWGSERYRTLALRLPLALLERATGRPRFSGHRPGSPYFWGDLARERFDYVRNFTFERLDSLSVAPYSLRSTPFVRHWFSTSDAATAGDFKRLVTREAVDRLLARGGTCILSTHLGKGFVVAGRVDAEVEDTLRYMASLPGWFVPVSEILDRLVRAQEDRTMPPWRRVSLEVSHLAELLRCRAKRLGAP